MRKYKSCLYTYFLRLNKTKNKDKSLHWNLHLRLIKNETDKGLLLVFPPATELVFSRLHLI